ncbi:RNA 3'-terminal phosphate cyclase-like 2 [Homarus americanus]|uniref:RNA 3'-terminal phosphate cyclase-like 2 n=1 Tax=Homarus americanus TaxID=6706 RepID=A0A8J5NB49_HOMAM|nr:RNA 3'-terminal phosphate cyclase-like 2 [Homarus americanus]
MGSFMCAEAISNSPGEDAEAKLPEDVGREAAWRMHFLRHLRDFFQVTFKIDEYKEKNFSFSDEVSEARTGASKLLLTCIGVGYSNISKGQT